MREVASKAAADKSTAGLLKIMDDIARLRAAPAPPIAAGGYRMLNVRSDRPRPMRAAFIAPLIAKPMRVRGFLTAVFAGGLGLAVLAGPVTCPSCDPLPSEGQVDAQRILSRLEYTRDLSTDAAARETPPPAQVEPTVTADRGEPPAVSAPAITKPADAAAPTSTAAIPPVRDGVPDSVPAAADATEPSSGAASLPQKIEELSDQGPPQTEIAAADVEAAPEAPLPPVGSTEFPHKTIIDADPVPEEPAPHASTQRKHSLVKQHRAKARVPAAHNVPPPAPKLYGPNKYRMVPTWAAKMYESPWQSKAFSFQ